MRGFPSDRIRRAPTPAAWTLAGAALLGAAPPPAPAPDVGPPPLTLQDALAEARRANAQLPVARLALEGAQDRAREARGLLYPSLSLDGDVHGGAPSKYASGDALLAVFVRAPLYDGGELRAGVDRTAAETDAFRAGFRMATRDVDYAVRVGFGRVLRAESSRAFRRHAIDRLRAYLAFVDSRRAAGQGVGADVLLARQRVAEAEADMATVTRDLNEARMELNDRLGRAPDAPLDLAPLPDPEAPAAASGEPWRAAPDLAQAAAQVQAAEADVRSARAGRRPHVALEANAGAQPVLGSSFEAPLNTGRDWGTEVVVSFSLPLWDRGVYRSRRAEADAALREARQRETVAQRATRLAWSRAEAALRDSYDELQAREHAVAVARDAYLQAESLYRGGQGRALDVLDAYDAWIQAGQNRLDVIYACRVARAEIERWGTP